MTPFDQAFPGLLKACMVLYALFLPWSLAILVSAFAFEFWHGPMPPGELIKFLIKLFLVVMLVSKSHDLINDGQALVQHWVEQNIPARPDNVAARYQQLLAAAQNAPANQDQSFWDTLFSSNFFEAIIYALLTLISWLSMAVLFLVYSVQRAVLLFCWALCPLLFPLLAIRPLSNWGLNHFLRIIGIILWPLGLALAATFTDGLLDTAAQQNLLAGSSVLGSLGYGLKTLAAVVVVAIWVLVSSVLAPVYIQRLVAGSGGATMLITKAADLMTGIALPGYLGIPSIARGLYRGGRATYAVGARLSKRFRTASAEADASVEPIPVPALPLPSTTSGPSVPGWKPPTSDPTGDLQVKNILAGTKSK